MPVYVRKNLMSITPDSLSNLSSDDDDYATDPDHMFDKLPQPYRLVDKILNRLYDVAWDLISAREAAAEELRSREPVPEYEFTTVVQEQEKGDVLCMTGSPDGSAVFLGLRNGLAAVHATLHSPLACWEEEGAAMVCLDSMQIGVQMCIVTSLDTNGVCRLFCFSSSLLFLLKTFDAEVPSGAQVVGMHLSQDGDYIALTLEKPKEKGDEMETWIDVFKLPRDNWIKDVEAAMSKQQQQQQQQQQDQGQAQGKSTEDLTKQQDGDVEGAVPDTIEYSHPMEGLSMPSSHTKSVSSQDTPRTVTPTAAVAVQPQPGATGATPEWNPASLAKPTTVLRVRPLPDRVTAATSVPHPGPPTPASEDWCSTLGLGNKHLLQADHLNTRRLVADNTLGPYADPKYAQPQKKPCRAMCLFASPGMMLATTNTAPIAQEQAHIFVASWSNSTNVCLYNLLKSAKDLEHKPDRVWPNAGRVTAMTTGPSTFLVALGLEDGTVVLWDKHLSLPVMVHKVFTRPIRHLHILPSPPTKPATSPADRLAALQTRPDMSVLVGDAQGDLATLTGCYGDKPAVRHVYSGTWRDRRDGACDVTPIPTITDTALVVTKFGDMYLCNVKTGKKLCMMKLPKDFFLRCEGRRPIITMAATGQMLFVKGEKQPAEPKAEAEDSQTDPPEAPEAPAPSEDVVYAYGLHTFPCLTNLWRPLDSLDSKAPTLLHTTQAKARFDVLLANRLSEQQTRQVRMQHRWGALKQKAATRTR